MQAILKKYEHLCLFDQPNRSKEQVWAHLVIANGKMYIRDQNVMLCYEVKARK